MRRATYETALSWTTRRSKSCAASTPSCLGAIGPAIGDTRIAGGVLERGLLLRMRFGLDLYINYRPFRGVDRLAGRGM